MKKSNNSRRQFIKTSAALSCGYWVAGGVSPKQSRSAIEEVRFACVGVDGKGKSDSGDAAKSGKIVAICDIDDQKIEGRRKDDGFASAAVFNDYRKMFDEVGKSIDAVTVSTPDHLHGVVAAMALKNKKAVYCQKPLTRTIWEARRLADLAREAKVATQMGNQGSAMSGLREAAAKLKAGSLGQSKKFIAGPIAPFGRRVFLDPLANQFQVTFTGTSTSVLVRCETIAKPIIHSNGEASGPLGRVHSEIWHAIRSIWPSLAASW